MDQDIYEQVVAALGDEAVDAATEERIQSMIDVRLEAEMRDHTILSRAAQMRLVESIVADLVGFGPLDRLLQDVSIHEILVIGASRLFVTKTGVRKRVRQVFDNEAHVRQIALRLCQAAGIMVDETTDFVHGRLADGSRLTVGFPPHVDVVTITLHKYATMPITAENLLTWNVGLEDGLTFLEACVQGGLNILIVGNVNAGKTTLLNVLGSFVESHEFVVGIGDEVRIDHEEGMVFNYAPRVEGDGTANRLLGVIQQVGRMRPHRVLVDGLGGKALVETMIQPSGAWIGTMVGWSPVDALHQIAAEFKRYAPADWDHQRLIAEAIDVVVQVERLPYSYRFQVTHITEVLGVADGNIVVGDIFRSPTTQVRKAGPSRIDWTGTPPSLGLKEKIEWRLSEEMRSGLERMFDFRFDDE